MITSNSTSRMIHQSDSFWAMNERERIYVLKCVTVTLALVQNIPSCVKHIALVPSHTPNVSAVRPAVLEVRKRDAIAHMHTCSCTLRVELHVPTCLTSTFVKCFANGSLTAYQISAQSVQPFPRYEKRCARAHVQLCPTINFCTMPC